MNVVVAIVIVVIIIIIASNNTNKRQENIGVAGERKVSNILNSLPKEYRVINNAVIPDQKTDPNKNYTTQIDHLVVSPYGIFVVETKNYSGWIFGNEDSKRWKETFKTTKGNYFYNPIKQNWGHTYALAEHLNLNIRVFKPIVVFSNNCKLNVETKTPVVYMSNLKDTILNYKQEIIPQKDIEIIYNKIIKINMVNEEVENKHIQSISERQKDKENTIKQGKCPLCGGELKLRKGKYGEFFGCSNYPNCKFTYNGRL